MLPQEYQAQLDAYAEKSRMRHDESIQSYSARIIDLGRFVSADEGGRELYLVTIVLVQT